MIKSKVLASCIAATIMAASVTSISANAAKVPGVNSNFEYELSIQQISDSSIELTIFSTYNPGLSNLEFITSFDSTKYKYVRSHNNMEYDEGMRSCRSTGNNNIGIIYTVSYFWTDEYKPVDYFNNFEIGLIIEARDGNITDEDLSSFSVAVKKYTSQTENVDYEVPTESVDPQIIRTITPSNSITYDYYVGDANGSGKIELDDVANILTLSSVSKATNTTPSINILNHKISNNESSVQSNGNTVYWENTCGSFMRNVSGVSFPCVESADADNDGYITQNDGNIVIDWYGQIGASSVSPSDVLQLEHKTVYF